MATKLTLAVPEVAVQNRDVQFDVVIDGEKLGTLTISKGGVDWYAKNARRPTKSYTWKQFRKLIEG